VNNSAAPEDTIVEKILRRAEANQFLEKLEWLLVREAIEEPDESRASRSKADSDSLGPHHCSAAPDHSLCLQTSP
jgi:hypothetical protein